MAFVPMADSSLGPSWPNNEIVRRRSRFDTRILATVRLANPNSSTRLLFVLDAGYSSLTFIMYVLCAVQPAL